MPYDIAAQVVDEFRSGRLDARLDSGRVVLVTATAHDTGKPRTVPVRLLLDGGRRTLAVVMPDEMLQLPAWYQDILVDPRVTMETGAFTVEATAEVLDDAERDAVLARAVEAEPELARRGWPVPVVALRPLKGRPSGDTWSENLKLIHDVYRRELGLIRRELARPGPRLGAQLRINCLNICAGLEHHHGNEDADMLPLVERHHPELADALRRVRQEHGTIADLVHQLREVIGSVETDRATVLAEVERLTTAVEAHLDFEEDLLLPVLDALPAEGGQP